MLARRCCCAPAGRRERDRIDEILSIDRPDARSAHVLAGRCSHGQKQWLEIGMLLMQDPKLLLVDEPVAGMTDAGDRAHRRAAARRSPATHSVVVVEHDMDFVRALGAR